MTVVASIFDPAHPSGPPAPQPAAEKLEPGTLTPQRRCRFCGAELTHTFVDLGVSPLANSNLEAAQLNQMEPHYPLHAYVCGACFLVQIEQVATPGHIFSDYAYLSSYSDSWVRHAKDYVDMIVPRLKLGPQSQVIEIASNDGYLLQFFVERGIPAMGVDPAANAAAIAVARGIPTRVNFFGMATAVGLAAEGMAPDLVICNNVLAHVPDLNDFVSGLRMLLGKAGVVTAEFPHLLRLITDHQFDTIYHEHFSYFSLITIMAAFALHGLTVFDVEEVPTHGGSLRIYARHEADDSKPVRPAVAALVERERAAGLTSLSTYLAFAPEVTKTKRSLLHFLLEAKDAGRSIVGYGAPAKGNTLLNYCGVRSDFIDYVVDVNVKKQGRYLPGTHIPILAPEHIIETKPDYLLLLPWNLKDEIMRRMAFVRAWGCRFVTPIPDVTIYP